MNVLFESIYDHFYSFPDSLGDDLIVEVQDSTGKHLGCAHVQVATIADDSVRFYPDIFPSSYHCLCWSM